MAETMNCTQALASARQQGLDRLDAQLLLLHALDKPATDRAWLLAHDRASLPVAVIEHFQALCLRLASGEPLAYLVQHQAFHGLDLQVDPRVLIPRPDTETLVNWALALLKAPGEPDNARVLDLGTGSGAVALALKHSCPSLSVSAIDASADAVAVAQENARRLGLTVSIALSCWFERVQGVFDMIVSNPPYVRDDDPHLPALRHEPLQALTAGVDGLSDVRQIIAGAPGHLRTGGWLLLEHGYDQADAVCQLLRQQGFGEVASQRDLPGIQRCSGGRWPGLGSTDESAR